ncbi:hypothetical protein [Verrucomicrobium spinosum]|uniref:hypothetical protein n=1 Tax=Verrucomicrobium spinosum TaxID=2736 RepID=UPI00017455AA|nr:hypothetical protein [Verrucomicrobium spinosum]
MQPDFTTTVKKALIDRHLSVTDLAKKLKRSRNAVSRVINHPTVHPKLRKMIKEELRLP